MQVVAWNCNGSSMAPLADYMNNAIFQELPDKDTYFSTKNDDRIYLDLIAQVMLEKQKNLKEMTQK